MTLCQYVVNESDIPVEFHCYVSVMGQIETGQIKENCSLYPFYLRVSMLLFVVALNCTNCLRLMHVHVL